MAKAHSDEQRWKKALRGREDFLINRLAQEWDAAEQSAHRAELINAAKASAKVIAKSVLILLAIAGFVTISAVTPNIFAVYGFSGRRRKFFNRKNLQKTVNYLQARKYTLKKRGESGYTLRLTKKGRDLALRRIFQDFQIPRPAHWDGWWHVVLFDIPNRRKHARDSLRKRLKTLGFYPLQESVFVFPYPCDDEITFFTSLYNIGDYVRMIKTNKLLSDDDIREFFALA